MMKPISAFLGFAATVLLAPFSWAGADTVKPQAIPADQAQAQVQALIGGTTVDLSRIVVARLKMNGEVLDVVSVQPRIQAEQGEGANKAITVMALTADRENLVLMTATAKEGWRLEVPVKDLTVGRKLGFPVLDAAGKVTSQEIEVVSITSRP